MSRLFNTSYSGKTGTGKQTFGQFAQLQSASDYISSKKTKNIYCSQNPCLPKTVTVRNQGDYLLSKKANYLQYFNGLDNIRASKTNLTNGLITKLDLKDVSVIKNTKTGQSPTTISSSSIPYLDYTIDPSGSLFGNTICGLNNFENYVVYNFNNINNITSNNNTISEETTTTSGGVDNTELINAINELTTTLNNNESNESNENIQNTNLYNSISALIASVDNNNNTMITLNETIQNTSTTPLLQSGGGSSSSNPPVSLSFYHVTSGTAYTITRNLIICVDIPVPITLPSNPSDGLSVIIVNNSGAIISVSTPNGSLIYNNLYAPRGANSLSLNNNNSMSLLFIINKTTNNYNWVASIY
jgi:hypothetical protein